MKKKITNTVLTVLTVLMLLCLAAPGALAAEIVLKVPFQKGQQVTATIDGDITFGLGEVLQVPGTTRWPSYTASAWTAVSTVCASAVNAVHLLVDRHEGRGRTISLLPSETIAPAAGENSFFVVGSRAGSGLFGAFAPPVGSSVSIRKSASGHNMPLDTWAQNEEWDFLTIEYSTESEGFLVDIENRIGGRVISWENGRPELIARVIRPVGGVGRFGGTKFQNKSRLRANHPGVIDVSTSDYGSIGGFQIIPLFHAFSKEMASAWELTQWMIVTGPEGNAELNGVPPLFSGYLVPGTQKGEKLWDLWSTYGRKSLILARRNGGKWEMLPEVTCRDDDALSEITHLRIYFPFDREPQI